MHMGNGRLLNIRLTYLFGEYMERSWYRPIITSQVRYSDGVLIIPYSIVEDVCRLAKSIL